MATETLANPAAGAEAPLEPPSPMAARLVSYSFSREAPLLIAHQRPDGLEVWVSRKTSPAALAEVARVHGALHLRVLEPAALEAAMSDAYNRQDGSAAQVVGEVEGEVDLSRLMQDIPAVEDLLESEDDAPIIRMINALLTQAAREQASDIHIEAGDRDIRAIVAAVYQGLKPVLRGAAALSVFAHLEDMVERGIVRSDGPVRLDGRFEPA